MLFGEYYSFTHIHLKLRWGILSENAKCSTFCFEMRTPCIIDELGTRMIFSPRQNNWGEPSSLCRRLRLSIFLKNTCLSSFAECTLDGHKIVCHECVYCVVDILCSTLARITCFDRFIIGGRAYVHQLMPTLLRLQLDLLGHIIRSPYFIFWFGWEIMTTTTTTAIRLQNLVEYVIKSLVLFFFLLSAFYRMRLLERSPANQRASIFSSSVENRLEGKVYTWIVRNTVIFFHFYSTVKCFVAAAYAYPAKNQRPWIR